MRLFYHNRQSYEQKQQEEKESYNVTKLRSIYASLLQAIKPEHERAFSSSSSVPNKHNGPPSTRSNDDSEDEDDLKTSPSPSGAAADSQCQQRTTQNQQVRNFRLSSQQTMQDEEDGETVHFQEEYYYDSEAMHNAWLRLSATTCPSSSPQQEEQAPPPPASKHENNVPALIRARRIESQVIELIRSIGEVVVYGEQSEMTNTSKTTSTTADADDENNPQSWNSKRRNNRNRGRGARRAGVRGEGQDAVFEYFCDKNMLSLLSDIARAKPSYVMDTFENNGNGTSNNGDADMMPMISNAPIGNDCFYSIGDSSSTPTGLSFNGVVWSALVKSQVLQTMSILVSNVQDPKSLYYLLSNNYINDLVSSFVPLQHSAGLHQWKESALEEILPGYISFLKTLALQLASCPYLFQFFCDDAHSSLPSFPLFYAAIEVATSPLDAAQSDNFVHTTALNIILNLCQLSRSSSEVQSVVGESFTEQRLLLSHLCRGINNQFGVMCRIIMTGKDNDNDESNSQSRSAKSRQQCENLKCEMTELEDQLHFLNDVLGCSVKTLNVRLCEFMLQSVVFESLLPNLLVCSNSSSSNESNDDEDDDDGDEYTNGEREACVQTAVYILAQIFMTMDYTPLLKMIAVALLHPVSPPEERIQHMMDARRDYVITPALNSIAQKEYIFDTKKDGKNKDAGNDDDDDDDDDDDYVEGLIKVHPNPYRKAFLSLLRKDHGESCFISAAMLLESILESKSIDFATLQLFEVIPDYTKSNSILEGTTMEGEEDTSTNKQGEERGSNEIGVVSPFEDALGHFFFEVQNTSSSRIGSWAVNCATSLSIRLINYLVNSMVEGGRNLEQFGSRFCSSPLVRGISCAKKRFAQDCQRLMDVPGVSVLFADLFQEGISEKYEFVRKNGTKDAIFDLRKNNAMDYRTNPEVFISSMNGADGNEVDDARFAIRMVLHLWLMDDVFCELHDHLTSAAGPASLGAPSRWCDSSSFEVRTICPASNSIIFLGGLGERPEIGTELDLRGREFFFFLPSMNMSEMREKTIDMSELARGPILTENCESEYSDRRRQIANMIISRATTKTEMIILIDIDQLFILKPKLKNGDESGTILYNTPLRNILAAASDSEWLHIAMQNVEDVGVLIKKGNMALRFRDEESCLDVKESLEKSKKECHEMARQQISELLSSSLAQTSLESEI